MNIGEIGRRLVSMTGRAIVCTLLWPVYLLSYLVPRSRNIWVFGSYKGNFVDNSKYLFLKQHHLKDSTPIICVWIAESRTQAREMRRNGYKSFWKLSPGGIFYCLRASLYVYSWEVSEINFWLSGGATLFGLWHGIPFKKIGKHNNENKKGMLGGVLKNNSLRNAFEYFLHPANCLRPHLFLSSNSKEVSTIFKQAFGGKRIVNALYPRVEHFILPENEQKEFISSISTSEEQSLIDKIKEFEGAWVYMPTFRDHKGDDKEMYSQNVFDFESMNPILQQKNVLLLVKYHYVAMADVRDKNEYSNIIFIDPKTDVYVILPYTSGLITDYSSIFFDYMLLRKPIIFYIFDINSYQNNSRQFYFPYDEVTCGRKIRDFKDLCDWFDNGDFRNSSFDYDPYIARFWGKTEKPFLLEQLYSINNNTRLAAVNSLQAG